MADECDVQYGPSCAESGDEDEQRYQHQLQTGSKHWDQDYMDDSWANSKQRSLAGCAGPGYMLCCWPWTRGVCVSRRGPHIADSDCIQ